MPVTGRRMVFERVGEPLSSWDVTVPDPEPGGALLRTVIAGVCGTDAHRLDGDLPAASGPIAFGHEGIGRVVELGHGLSTDRTGVSIAPGDLVYWTPSGAKPGDLPSTGWPPPAEVPSPAAYQDYATLSPTNVFYRIPDGVDPEAVIAFGCAMPTALGGLARLGGIRSGETVVIQGCGPVGLAATLLAALSPARHVIVIGAPDNRLRAAERLGATHTIALTTSASDERLATIRELTDGRGADVVIEATGRLQAFREGTGFLGAGGRYLVLGIYSGPGIVELDAVRLNNLNQVILGSLGPAKLEDLRTTIHLAERYGGDRRFADLVTHRFPLSQTESAIGVARNGVAIKAIVIPDRDTL